MTLPDLRRSPPRALQRVMAATGALSGAYRGPFARHYQSNNRHKLPRLASALGTGIPSPGRMLAQIRISSPRRRIGESQQVSVRTVHPIPAPCRVRRSPSHIHVGSDGSETTRPNRPRGAMVHTGNSAARVTMPMPPRGLVGRRFSRGSAISASHCARMPWTSWSRGDHGGANPTPESPPETSPIHPFRPLYRAVTSERWPPAMSCSWNWFLRYGRRKFAASCSARSPRHQRKDANLGLPLPSLFYLAIRFSRMQWGTHVGTLRISTSLLKPQDPPLGQPEFAVTGIDRTLLKSPCGLVTRKSIDPVPRQMGVNPH
jgi:hypothetical protein